MQLKIIVKLYNNDNRVKWSKIISKDLDYKKRDNADEVLSIVTRKDETSVLQPNLMLFQSFITFPDTFSSIPTIL